MSDIQMQVAVFTLFVYGVGFGVGLLVGLYKVEGGGK